MKIYLLYDDENDKNTLRQIIANNDLGLISGESNNPKENVENIIDTKPDLVIFDISKGDLSRLDIIKDVKEKN